MGFPAKTIDKRRRPTTTRKWTSARVQRPLKVSAVRDLQTIDTLAAYGGVLSTNVQYKQVYIPVAGTGTSSRYGDKTVVSSIQGAFVIAPGNAQTATVYVRALLLWDKQPNGADPTSPQPLTTNTVVSFPNTDFSYRFTILRDFVMPVAKAGSAPEGLAGQSSHSYVQKFFVSNQNLISQFISSGGTIADIATGALVVAVVTDTTYTANNTPNMSFNVRVKFSS